MRSLTVSLPSKLTYPENGEALRQEAVEPDEDDDNITLPAAEDSPLPLEAEQADTPGTQRGRFKADIGGGGIL